MELIGPRQQPKCKVPVNFNLFLFGDDHEGTILRHSNGWQQFCDHVNSSIDGLPVSSNLCVHHGDIIDAIDYVDPRYSANTVAGFIEEQREEAIQNMLPIAPNLICILEGNHTWKRRNYGLITKTICDRLSEIKGNGKVLYGTWSAKISYKDRRSNLLFKHFCTHGIKSIHSTSPDPIRRDAYEKFRLKRLLEERAGDTVLMSRGHIHKLIRFSPRGQLYLTDDGENIHQAFTKAPHDAEYIDPDLRWYISTGSFLKTQMKGVSSYSEIAEYPPVLLGYMHAKIRDRMIEDIQPIVLD